MCMHTFHRVLFATKKVVPLLDLVDEVLWRNLEASESIEVGQVVLGLVSYPPWDAHCSSWVIYMTEMVSNAL